MGMQQYFTHLLEQREAQKYGMLPGLSDLKNFYLVIY